MTNVVCRGVDALFAVTVTLTTPGPLVLPASTVTQSTGTNLVQLQPDGTVTCMATIPPATSIEALDGLSVDSHAAPCCRMVKAWPATVTPPVRASPTFGWTVNVAVPFPARGAGEPSIQVTLVPAVQAHVGALAVTGTLRVPPFGGTTASESATVKWQAPASCAMVTSASLTPITECRGAGSLLGATR
jgi:hypothetical protein